MFADKNVGTGKTVTVSGIALTGTDRDNYELTSTTATASANITARMLTVNGIGAVDKTYDGSTNAMLDTSPHILEGKVEGDDLRLDQSRGGPSGLFADKNAGTGKTVTVSGIALTGTDRDNYELTSTTATTTANIDPRALTVGGISAVNKTYDGSTTATLDTSNATLTGVLQGESVALDTSRASGQFDTKDVGQGKAVTVTDFVLSGGADAANYRLADPTLMTSANIDPRALTVGGISAANKTYDGTTIATLDTGTHSLEGKVAGDELWLDQSRGGPSGAFADKNVGTGKTVTISGIALGGTDLGNYHLTSTTATTTADIGKAPLNIVANDATALATERRPPRAATAKTRRCWLARRQQRHRARRARARPLRDHAARAGVGQLRDQGNRRQPEAAAQVPTR